MKKLSLKLMATCFAALVAGQAAALAPNASTELTVVLSGASAQDQGLVNLILAKCTAGTIDSFSETGETDRIANYNGHSCSMPLAGLTLPAGVAVGNLAARDLAANGGNGNGSLEVIVLKRSAGGSGEGPNGVCNGVGIQHLLVDASCDDTQVNAAAPIQVAGDRIWKCPSLTTLKSDGGLSDLEINKLPGVFGSVCNGQATVTNPIWGTIFNTPVSLNLRNALQCVQGLTVGAEDEANMPSLPKSVVASVFNGGMSSWSNLRYLRVDTGAYGTLGQALTAKVNAGQCPGYSLATYPVPSIPRVHVCRRVESSGTNTQMKVKFLNEGCTSEAQAMLPDNTPNSPNNGTTFAQWQNVGADSGSAFINEASSSSNMNQCLSAFADTSAPSTQRWAIGIQSLENNVPNASGVMTSAYRFIKIDGSAPTVKNVIENKYFDWVESVWVWLTPVTNLEKDKVDLQKVLLDGTGSAADVATANTKFIHAFGQSGLVALKTITGNTPVFPVNVTTTPVATSTHAGSSCRTPQVTGNTSF
jgi:hypothetical protein